MILLFGRIVKQKFTTIVLRPWGFELVVLKSRYGLCVDLYTLFFTVKVGVKLTTLQSFDRYLGEDSTTTKT